MTAEAALSNIAAWVTAAGLAGKSETRLLEGFCLRMVEPSTVWTDCASLHLPCEPLLG